MTGARHRVLRPRAQIDYPQSIVRFFTGTPGRPLPRDPARLRRQPAPGLLARGRRRFLHGLDPGGAARSVACSTPGARGVPRHAAAGGTRRARTHPDTGKVGIGMMVEGQAKQATPVRPGRPHRGRADPPGDSAANGRARATRGASWGHDLIIGHGFLKTSRRDVRLPQPGHQHRGLTQAGHPSQDAWHRAR